MGKFFNILFIAVALMVLLQLYGINTGNDDLFNQLGLSTDNQDVDFTGGGLGAFLLSDTGILALLALGGGIIVGFILTRDIGQTLKTGFVTGFAGAYLGTFKALVSFGSGAFPAWANAILLIIFSLLGVGLLITFPEWIGGHD